MYVLWYFSTSNIDQVILPQRNNLFFCQYCNNDYRFDATILIRPMSKLIFFTEKPMGKKCCVTNCGGNYKSKSKEKVFRLLVNENKSKRWLSVIPRENALSTKNTIVFERHWANDYETEMHLLNRDH